MLTAVNGHSIAYDNSGNPISYYNGSSYTGLTWEQGRNLTRITTGGKTTTYAYDQDGIRTQKTVNGVLHTYITQNGKVVRETIGTGSTAKVLDFIYDESGRPFAMNYSTNGGGSFGTYFYILNLQGDVVMLVENIPGVGYSEKATYTYDAWGNILTSTGTLASVNPLRYRGYYYDTETGFYYLQSRYYDPTNHRFINADSYASTGQGFVGTNIFAYCNNNPIMFDDSRGNRATYCTMMTDSGGSGRGLDPDSDPAAHTAGVINGQENAPYGDIGFGLTDIASAGCGVLASYNALWLLGRSPSLRDIINEYEGSRFSARFFGVFPSEMDNCFENYLVSYKGTYSLEKLNKMLSNGGIAVITFWNKEAFEGVPNIFIGAHTVAIKYDGIGTYYVYNAYSKDTAAKAYSSIEKYIGRGLFYYGYYLWN